MCGMKKAGMPEINKSLGPGVRTSIEIRRQLLRQSTGKQGGDSQSDLKVYRCTGREWVEPIYVWSLSSVN